MIIGAVIRLLVRLFKSRQQQNGSEQQPGTPGQAPGPAPAQDPNLGLGMRRTRRRQRRF